MNALTISSERADLSHTYVVGENSPLKPQSNPGQVSYLKVRALIRTFSPGLFAFIALLRVHGATLSDNLDKVPAGAEVAFSSNWLAASFRTDGQEYLNLNASLVLAAPAGTTASVFVFSDRNNQPSQALAELQQADQLTPSPSIVNFSGNTTPLLPNSLFWLVLESRSGLVNWFWTESSEGTGVGFTHTWAATEDAGSTWLTADYQPQMMSVNALPTPEPNAGVLLLFGFTSMIVCEKALSCIKAKQDRV